MRANFNQPIGAVWVHGFKMKQEILDSLNHKLIDCPACKERFFPAFTHTDIVLSEKHVLSIKINSYQDYEKKKRVENKEKYIAVANSKKSKRKQPDYFIHVQYEYTGANAMYPFRVKGHPTKVDEITPKRDNVQGDQTGGACSVPSGV